MSQNAPIFLDEDSEIYCLGNANSVRQYATPVQDEELPPPEPVTVCVIPDEFCEDLNAAPEGVVNPLQEDPLNTDPLCEDVYSQEHVKTEPSGTGNSTSSCQWKLETVGSLSSNNADIIPENASSDSCIKSISPCVESEKCAQVQVNESLTANEGDVDEVENVQIQVNKSLTSNEGDVDEVGNVQIQVNESLTVNEGDDEVENMQMQVNESLTVNEGDVDEVENIQIQMNESLTTNKGEAEEVRSVPESSCQEILTIDISDLNEENDNDHDKNPVVANEGDADKVFNEPANSFSKFDHLALITDDEKEKNIGVDALVSDDGDMDKDHDESFNSGKWCYRESKMLANLKINQQNTEMMQEDSKRGTRRHSPKRSRMRECSEKRSSVDFKKLQVVLTRSDIVDKLAQAMHDQFYDEERETDVQENQANDFELPCDTRAIKCEIDYDEYEADQQNSHYLPDLDEEAINLESSLANRENDQSNTFVEGSAEPLSPSESLGTSEDNGRGAALQPLRCSQCRKVFQNIRSLRGHLPRCIKRKHQCVLCQQNFGSKGKLQYHMKCHEKMKLQSCQPFTCTSCNKAFLSLSGLHGHRAHCHLYKIKRKGIAEESKKKKKKRNVTAGSGYKCVVCHQLFNSMVAMKIHMTKKGHTTKSSEQKNLNVEQNLLPSAESDFVLSPSNSLVKREVELEQISNVQLKVSKEDLHSVPYNDSRRKATVDKGLAYDLSQSNHECTHCKMTFPSPGALRKHNINHHTQSQLSCNKCGKRFIHYHDFMKHERTHKQSLFSCDICHKVFGKVYGLNAHRRVHSAEKKRLPVLGMPGDQSVLEEYGCHLCPQVLTSKHSLEEHTRLHKRGKKFSCLQCTEVFFSQALLNDHTKQIHGTDSHWCSCGVKCDDAESLRLHSLTHEQGLHANFSCEICQESFTSDHQLREHDCSHKPKLGRSDAQEPVFHVAGRMKMRRGRNTDSKLHRRRKFPCVFCKRDFLSISGRRRHMFLHTGMPLQCQFCDKGFSIPSVLRCHIRLKHSIERPYECGECENTYTRLDKLRIHEKNVHMKAVNPVKCNLCNGTFSSIAYLKRHTNSAHRNELMGSTLRNQMTVKSYKCQHCEIVCTSLENLQEHIQRYHTTKPKDVPVLPPSKRGIYECDECGESFHNTRLLTRHYCNVHSEKARRATPSVPARSEKILKCNRCNESFFKKSDLIEHERLLHSGNNAYSRSDHSKSNLLNGYKKQCRSCLMCGKSFALLEDLKEHMLIHTTEESSFCCRFCSATFASENSLHHHMRIHDGSLSIQSDNLCETSVTKEVRYPSKKKSKEGKYLCNICGKGFSGKKSLYNHKRRHLKRFVCQICNKEFDRHTRYIDHKRQHEISGMVSGPYKCDLCDKVFSKMGFLIRHKSRCNSSHPVIKTE